MGLSSISSQACNACHYSIHDEWASSAHASSWKSPRVMKAARDAGDPTACKACHLPLQNQHSSLTKSYQTEKLSMPVLSPNPSWDPTLQVEGVTCAACHIRDGVVLGPRATAAAPHPVRQSDDIGSPMSCSPCHQLSITGTEAPYYDTYGEWRRSAYREAGIGCKDCHMPLRSSMITASRFASHRSHLVTADVSRALSLLMSLDSPRLTRGEAFGGSLLLQNTGAGHYFPTGSPLGTITLQMAAYQGDTPRSAPFTYRLGWPTAEENGTGPLPDTRIPPGGQVEVSFTITVPQKSPAGDAELRVILVRSGSEEVLLTRNYPITIQ